MNGLFRLIYVAALLFTFGFLFSCQDKNTIQEGSESANNKFDAYKEAFVEKLWELHPEWASAVGYHKYDAKITIPNDAHINKIQTEYEQILQQLEKIDPEELSAVNRTDYQLMLNHVQSQLWYSKEFRSYEWNPAEYNIGNSVAEIFNGRYDSLETRLRAISDKLERAADYYETTKNNLVKPTVPHTELAIQQNRGALSVFGSAMLDSVQKSNLSEQEKVQLQNRIVNTIMAIENYVKYLERILPNLKAGEARDFRIGGEKFRQKFAYDLQAGFTADEIYERARKRKAELLTHMTKLSKQLWPKYFPDQAMPADSLQLIRTMIGKLSENHVKPEEFVAAVKKQIPELVAFVDQHNLLTQDPEKPLVVRETPAHERGFAGASIAAPGPYDKTANTYYNVTPLEDMTPAEAESYLREYNNYTLQILNIHEAIPGHYTQLVYSNQSPSIIKAVLGNGAMVEGWAVYTEKMMLEEGYGNHSPELELMYDKWHLRVVSNTILDYNVHVQGMKEPEALQMLMQEAFQEEAEARGKWRRATLSQVQLCSYFTGFTEIYELREELKKKQGEAFNLKAFHEKFLSYGSAPVKYIRELMLGKSSEKVAMR